MATRPSQLRTCDGRRLRDGVTSHETTIVGQVTALMVEAAVNPATGARTSPFEGGTVSVPRLSLDEGEIHGADTAPPSLAIDAFRSDSRVRLTAPMTACSEAVTMVSWIPTPHRGFPPSTLIST